MSNYYIPHIKFGYRRFTKLYVYRILFKEKKSHKIIILIVFFKVAVPHSQSPHRQTSKVHKSQV